MDEQIRVLASRVTALELIVAGLFAERAIEEPDPRAFLTNARERFKSRAFMNSLGSDADLDPPDDMVESVRAAIDRLFESVWNRLIG